MTNFSPQDISIGDKIKSKRTGKILMCYSKINVWLENKIIDVEYSFWDTDKKKSKSYKSKNLFKLLLNSWYKL